MKKSLFLICLLPFAVACTDDIEDDVDSLMKVQPQGLVLLQNEILIQNSNSAEIPFRVNPSHYPLQAEDISLDVFSSDFQRSFPVTSIPEYHLDSVVPAKDRTGHVKEGEWRAFVHVAEGKYYSDAVMALVLKYRDARNKECMLTSSGVAQMKTVPVLTEDMIHIDNYSVMSAFGTDGKFSCQEFTVTPAPISEGSEVLYDMKGTRIDSFRLEGNNAGMFQLDRLDDWKFSIGPGFLFNFSDTSRYVDVDLVFYFKDLYCDNPEKAVVEKRKNMKFYKTELTPEMKVIRAGDIVPRDTAAHISPHVMIPLEAVLAECGIQDEVFDTENYTVSCIKTRVVDDEGNPMHLPLIPKFVSDGGILPSDFSFKLNLYAALKEEDYGKKFNIAARIVYMDVRTARYRFVCDLTYPMKFEK